VLSLAAAVAVVLSFVAGPPDPASADEPVGEVTWLAADLTGDGQDELVRFAAATGEWTVGVARDGGFEFSVWGDFHTRDGWQTHLVADVTGDGAHEIVSFHRNGTWWVSSADGDALRAERWTTFTTSSGWQDHLVADLTGDGQDEIASVHANGSWWVNVGDGDGFTWSRWADDTASGWQTHLVADVTGDGQDEIASFHDNGTWWVGRGDGDRLASSHWATFTSTAGWLEHLVADLTGDGQQEIANHHRTGTWWVNQGDGDRFDVRAWGEAEPAFRWEATTLTADVRDEMTGTSWQEGCPVGLDELRSVHLTHHTFDGDVQDGHLIVHASVVDDLEHVFATMFEERFPLTSVEPAYVYDGDDDAIMAANASHAFNCRQITGGDAWSEHSYGTAIDLNPIQNPYERDGEVLPPEGEAYLDRTDVRPGMLLEGDAVVSRFDELGWDWGGRWETLVDYMHFELPR
jgi:hypothetical protein